jgi:DNA primase
MIEDYTCAIDWLIRRNEQLFDLKAAEGKRHFTDELLPLVYSLDDPVEKDHYITLIANKLNISKTAIEAKTSLPIKQEGTIKKRKIKTDMTLLPKEQIEIEKVEDHLLCIMLKKPELRDRLSSLSVDMLSREQPIELVSILKNKPLINEAELNRLDSIADYVKIESLQYEELYQGLEQNELIYEAARLQVRLIEYYVKNQKLNIAKQLVQADDKTIEDLLEQARRLDELLRNNLEEIKYA